MKNWSHTPVKDFKTTIFVDTNILCYLVDSTYPSLNRFIEQIKTSSLFDLISSEYVLLEFIGVRKREHYLREALSQNFQKTGKTINISSLLKYNNQYSLPEIKFHTLLPEIKSKVDAEKEKISLDFGINFSSGFHRELLNPTSDICLNSKISKEDSLVLVSAIIPEEGRINENVILFTNDADFQTSFYDKDVELAIDNVFNRFELKRPDLQNIRSITGANNQRINFTETENTENVLNNFNSIIIKKLQNKLHSLFIGITFVPKEENFPSDCIALKVMSKNTISKNNHITIIGNDLDYVYNTEDKISFWNNGQEVTEQGFIATEGNSYLSFKLSIDNAIPDKDSILTSLKQEGNLIFIHPDN